LKAKLKNKRRKVEFKMKKELNLELDEHVKLLQDIAVKAIESIDVKEIIKLKKLFHERETHEYFN
jgi:hypothetical protein